jgi:hypothetical protein
MPRARDASTWELVQLHEGIVGTARCHWGLLSLRAGKVAMSHTIESGVTDTEATPVSASLCVDPAAPGAKTTMAATPTSVNPARTSWMMRTGSPLTELLGQLTLDVHGCR